MAWIQSCRIFSIFPLENSEFKDLFLCIYWFLVNNTALRVRSRGASSLTVPERGRVAVGHGDISALLPVLRNRSSIGPQVSGVCPLDALSASISYGFSSRPSLTGSASTVYKTKFCVLAGDDLFNSPTPHPRREKEHKQAG